jgi:hypothetical protein
MGVKKIAWGVGSIGEQVGMHVPKEKGAMPG